ncbi:hypothetical protein S7335_3870 [Synechococcus sp. PCC 7335]|uniref:hypothetical protein n=1 Tax=Synechococcus sp. (strain ATCC 29403 / PCC 7335) TaxID=91464 RepID=UPI00017ED28E|nr:hypothetical protein [Synechococcus sp. PCC 7335]EDX86167.1 hypothetical protein S7335_3870 [Synechococcus sp. PCC 7335]
MEFLLASALLIVTPVNISQEDSPPSLPPVQVPIDVLEQGTDTDQMPVTCAPGQFPSAFADVFPTDWAYQAVIRLSSWPVECFDFPTERLEPETVG